MRHLEALPHVIVNMAMSVDGKITTYRRERFALGSDYDRRLMDLLRSRADAVIIGAGTVRHDGHPVLIRYHDLREKRVARGRSPHPINVVLSRKLDMPPTKPIFEHPDTEKIVFTTRAAPAARLTRFRRFADVVVLGGRSLSPHAVLHDRYCRRVRNVLLEGGGELHFAFAKAGVVDELYITVTPRLIGGASAPTVLDGKGFLAAHHPRLRIISSRRVGDEMFLKYRIVRD
jgi:riboflavin-specific deaminase-like protein